LLEFAGEMEHRQAGDRGEHHEIDAVAQMRVDVFAHPTHRCRRQTAAYPLGWRWRRQRAEYIEARAGVQGDRRGAAPGAQGAVGRRDERRTAVLTADDHQSCRDVVGVLASEKRKVAFKNGPQADARFERGIIEHEGGAGRAVRPDDALVAVDRQQRGRLLFG